MRVKRTKESATIDGRACSFVVTILNARKYRDEFLLWFIYNVFWLRPFNTLGALERAKHAVESQYAVVGVLEDLNTTLAVFEKYIPGFFRGATDIYYGKSLNISFKITEH